VLFNSLYVLDYKNSKFYYMAGYSVYFSVGCLAVIVMYVQCGHLCPVLLVQCGHLCPVLLSVLSVIILEKSGGCRSVLEIWNDIISSQLESLVQFPIWGFFFC